MTREIDMTEAQGRQALAASAYRLWPTDELWEELVLVIDEAWDGRGTEDGPEPNAWATREAIGLALIARGASAAEVERGLPPGQSTI